MAYVPAVRVLTVVVACPLAFTAALPIGVDPAKKVMVPGGVPAIPLNCDETVADNVAAWRACAGLGVTAFVLVPA